MTTSLLALFRPRRSQQSSGLLWRILRRVSTTISAFAIASSSPLIHSPTRIVTYFGRNWVSSGVLAETTAATSSAQATRKPREACRGDASHRATRSKGQGQESTLAPDWRKPSITVRYCITIVITNQSLCWWLAVRPLFVSNYI